MVMFVMLLFILFWVKFCNACLYGQALSESFMRLFWLEITRFDSRGWNNKSSKAIVIQNYCL